VYFMKKTLLWGALLTILCSQAEAGDTTSNPPAAQPAVQETNAAKPVDAQPATQPVQAAKPVEMQSAVQPVQAAPVTAPIINCNYKIDPNNKTIDETLVQSWSEKATTQAFNFAPTSLDAQMQDLQSCFTEQGWNGFNAALDKSGNLDAIKSQHLTVSSQIDGQTKIDEAKDNQWKLTLPLQVVYQNDKEKVTQLLNIKLTVSRKPTGDLGITQMVATPRDGEHAATAAPATTAPAEAAPASTATAPAAATPAETAPASTAPAPATATPESAPAATDSATTTPAAPADIAAPEAKP
jgi:hypothetical protein